MAPKKDQLSKDTKNSGKNVVTASNKSHSSANSATSASSGPFTRSKTKLATSHASQVTPVKSAQAKATVDDKLKPKKLPSVTEDDAAKIHQYRHLMLSQMLARAQIHPRDHHQEARTSQSPQSNQTLMQILTQ